MGPELRPSLRLTYHMVPGLRPDSVKVTAYFAEGNFTGVNVTFWVTFFPLMDIEPLDVVRLYPETLEIVYEYVPLTAVKSILSVVDDSEVPLNVTDHEVPEVSPDSTKLAPYCFWGLGCWRGIMDMVPDSPLPTNNTELAGSKADPRGKQPAEIFDKISFVAPFITVTLPS